MTEMKRIPLPDMVPPGNGEMAPVKAGDWRVLVCRVRDKLYAVEDQCSHADSALRNGKLKGFLLTCPLHLARFDVRNGDHQGPPAFCGIRTFAVEEIDGEVVVEVPAEKPAGRLGAR